MKGTPSMNQICIHAGCIGGLALIAFALPAHAQVEHDFTFEAAAGVEYDDNITVTEIDAETNEDDFAAVFEASIDYEAAFSDTDSLSLGYSFSQTEQFDLSAFDLQIHGTNVTYEHDFESFSAGLTHQFFFTRLGGNDLLDMNRITPFITAFPAKWMFLRASYTYKDKNLINRIDRDAKTHMGEIMSFFFVDGTDSYLTALYRFESEDAKGPEFDFDAHIVKAGLRTRLPFGGEDNRLSFDAEYEARDYEAITPSIGEIRDDDRFTFDASWEVPFGDIFYAEIEYQYRDFSSNLPSSNFTENRAGIKIGLEY